MHIQEYLQIVQVIAYHGIVRVLVLVFNMRRAYLLPDHGTELPEVIDYTKHDLWVTEPCCRVVDGHYYLACVNLVRYTMDAFHVHVTQKVFGRDAANGADHIRANKV